MWITDDPMVGGLVYIQTGYGETELATVLAVSSVSTNIKVKAHDDGAILVGNQWDDGPWEYET